MDGRSIGRPRPGRVLRQRRPRAQASGRGRPLRRGRRPRLRRRAASRRGGEGGEAPDAVQALPDRLAKGRRAGAAVRGRRVRRRDDRVRPSERLRHSARAEGARARAEARGKGRGAGLQQLGGCEHQRAAGIHPGQRRRPRGGPQRRRRGVPLPQAEHRAVPEGRGARRARVRGGSRVPCSTSRAGESRGCLVCER